MGPLKRLGSDQRIRRQTTFKHLVETGLFARGDFFYLWVGRRETKTTTPKTKPMIGISVSRKTDPKAVGRNTWKRRVREIFRENQGQLRRDAVCLVKIRRFREKPAFKELKEDLIRLFKKTGVWE